jgi:hypothetical protein
MSACARCGRFIAATTQDPVVSSTGLGGGAYHYTCFRDEWNDRHKNDLDKREASRARRSESMRARWKRGELKRKS